MNLSAKDEIERIDLLDGRELSVQVALANGYSWYTTAGIDKLGVLLEEKDKATTSGHTLYGKEPPKFLAPYWDFDLPNYSGNISHAFLLISRMERNVDDPFRVFLVSIVPKTAKVTARFDLTTALADNEGDIEEQVCTAICRAYLKWILRRPKTIGV